MAAEDGALSHDISRALLYASDQFDEVYEIVRTVVVWMDDKQYRIEVRKSHTQNSEIPYTCQCDVRLRVKEWGGAEGPVYAWVKYDLPFLMGHDADTALRVAVEHLRGKKGLPA